MCDPIVIPEGGWYAITATHRKDPFPMTYQEAVNAFAARRVEQMRPRPDVDWSHDAKLRCIYKSECYITDWTYDPATYTITVEVTTTDGATVEVFRQFDLPDDGMDFAAVLAELITPPEVQ